MSVGIHNPRNLYSIKFFYATKNKNIQRKLDVSIATSCLVLFFDWLVSLYCQKIKTCIAIFGNNKNGCDISFKKWWLCHMTEVAKSVNKWFHILAKNSNKMVDLLRYRELESLFLPILHAWQYFASQSVIFHSKNGNLYWPPSYQIWQMNIVHFSACLTNFWTWKHSLQVKLYWTCLGARLLKDFCYIISKPIYTACNPNCWELL